MGTRAPSTPRLIAGVILALAGLVLLAALGGVRLLFESPHRWTARAMLAAAPGVLCLLVGYYMAALDLLERRASLDVRGGNVAALVVMVIGAVLLLPLALPPVRRRETIAGSVVLATVVMSIVIVIAGAIAITVSRSQLASFEKDMSRYAAPVPGQWVHVLDHDVKLVPKDAALPASIEVCNLAGPFTEACTLTAGTMCVTTSKTPTFPFWFSALALTVLDDGWPKNTSEWSCAQKLECTEHAITFKDGRTCPSSTDARLPTGQCCRPVVLGGVTFVTSVTVEVEVKGGAECTFLIDDTERGRGSSIKMSLEPGEHTLEARPARGTPYRTRFMLGKTKPTHRIEVDLANAIAPSGGAR